MNVTNKHILTKEFSNYTSSATLRAAIDAWLLVSPNMVTLSIGFFNSANSVLGSSLLQNVIEDASKTVLAAAVQTYIAAGSKYIHSIEYLASGDGIGNYLAIIQYSTFNNVTTNFCSAIVVYIPAIHLKSEF